MDNRNRQQVDAIDLMEYVNLLKSKIVWILLCGAIFASAGYYYAAYRIVPTYQASINLIVNADTESTTMVTISDVHSAASLVDTYAVVIKSNRVLDKVVEELGLNMSWAQLNGKVTVSAVNETSVMQVAVTDSDPDEALRIVLKISEVAPAILVDAVKAGSCEIVSDAYSSGYPVSPNVRGITQKAFLLGMVLSAGVFVLLHLLKNTVTSEEDLQDILELPVLGVIPDIDSFGRRPRRPKRPKKGGKH